MPEAATHVASGKVREIYALDDERLLLVASDRISTFDVVLPTEIPDKGRVLTGLSGFWFTLTREIVPNHLLAIREDGRSIECRRLEMLPIECVVRGYLAGSGWKDYRGSGEVCGHRAARRAARVGPAARADLHAGDEGADRARREHHARAGGGARRRGAAARGRGRVDPAVHDSPRSTRSRAGSSSPTRSSSSGSTPDGALVLGDEALTPDSSRFWPADDVRAGPRRSRQLRQAVRPRLLRDDRLGQDRARAGAAGGRRRRHAREVRRGVRAADGAPVRPTISRARRWCSGEGDRSRPPEGGDPRPAGRRPSRRRSSTSGSRSSGARVGKVIDLEVDAADAAAARAQVEQMCERLLANPLIESYEIEVDG